MPYTDLQIANIGMGKIGASRLDSIRPPRTSLEKHVAENYEFWKELELSIRRWNCAMVHGAPLFSSGDRENADGLKYEYPLPADCLRPIRDKHYRWRQEGRSLFSDLETGLKLDYIRNIDEASFDVYFVDVLASKIVMESAEYITQSNRKVADRAQFYDRSVRMAAKANAFVKGPERIDDEQGDFEFLTGRF